MANDARRWLTAAQCAQLTGLTVRALHVYEREGLLSPSRSAKGWRRYGPDDLVRLNTIAVMKALGLTLAQIGELLRERNPSLLSVLQVQAQSWRERQGAAAKALALVEGVIATLRRHQQLTLEQLCTLMKELQSRSNPMHKRATLIADLMKELLTTDEQWQWQSWWASHPEDMERNTAYLRERAEGFAALMDLQRQGVAPSDPAPQEQILKQLALIRRYGVRERTVRLMDWNRELTAKFMEMGAIAREREPDTQVMPFPLVSQQLTSFYEQVLLASAPMRAFERVCAQAQSLLEAHVEPTSAAARPVIQELETVCVQHGLGDPTVYVRFMPFLVRVNRQALPPPIGQAYEFLRQALAVHGSPAAVLDVPAAPPVAPAPPIDFSSGEMHVVRRAFARQLGMMAGIVEPRLEAVFACVEREKYLGPGPWRVLSMLRFTFMTTPDASPVQVYVDSAVSILQEKGLNNGQPSLYYRLLAEAQVPAGAHIVHIGAGTGYFTAILGKLTGPTGKVTAIEFEADLAARAHANLQSLPQVQVIHGDATQVPFEPADLILVSAGATRPLDHWLDGLTDGGQLLLPLTPDTGMGIIVCIRRRGERHFAKVVSPVMIYRCAGARDPQSESALAAALKGGGQRGITRLYRGEAPPVENVWLQGENWCLAYG
ncbi:MAG TPA: MerR family transcriptional regulator [Steroidobacteraceae bacterium]